jgi:LacI family transcriptional regulator
MKRTGNRPARRPHVALLVETSLASGRDILRGIARYVREHAPWALYHEPRSLEQSAPTWLLNWQGDGILARVQTPAMAEAVRATGIPTVDILGVVSGTGLPLVHVDDTAIGRMGAEHLLERGFRSFGYFGIEQENWSERRRRAFAETVCQAGFALSEYTQPRFPTDDDSWEATTDQLARWIAALPKPAGIMVCSDQRGQMLLEACRRGGAAVPDDVAVVGVDDDEPLCEVCNPPLSSIQPNHAQVGYAAAGLLTRLMAGKTPPDSAILVPPLGVVIRASSDVLAIEDRTIATALKLIRENACRNLRVDDLARQCGLSRSVLQRRFQTVLRRTVHAEILNTRLKRARELLQETDLSLAEIAERTGFKHQEYMGAVFKAQLGTTPGRLRQTRRP